MSEWISVKDRLPPECEDVLIYSNGFSIIGAFLAYGTNGPICWQVNDWDESEISHALKEVTHWMSLPNPPEEK